MFNDMRILALIPARGGSKGIKNKNIIDIGGKPLISYTIAAGKQSRYIDDVVVTTDSETIKDVAIKYGADVPFLRPAELAKDTSTSLDAVLHAVHELENQGRNYDVLILLQPTSPLRTAEDIDSAIEKFNKYGCESLVSVSEVKDHPIFMRKIIDDRSMEKFLNQKSTIRRQDMPPIYRVNGGIYINLIKELNEDTSFGDNKVPFIMEQRHSVDVDEYSDIALVEYYLNHESKEAE